MKHKITCDKCEGKGTMEMPEGLLETLALIPKKAGVTTEEIHGKIPGITRNAQNNRLEKLRALGFVKRIREGKFWRYSQA